MKFHTPDPNYQDAGGLNLDHLMADVRWHPLVDFLPDGVVLVDRSGLVRYINSAAEAATEVLRMEVMDKSLEDFAARARIDITFTVKAFASGLKTSRIVSDSAADAAFQVITRCVRDWHGKSNCMLVVLRSIDTKAYPAADSGPKLQFELESDHAAQSERNREGPAILGEQAKELFERGLRTLALGSRVLLVGESGVGKTEFAKLLHSKSGGKVRPFVHVNCGSIPETLFESEMFGYERGSFTGALAKGKRGLVEAADGGTVFLDEVGEIPLSSQAKMLHFIEEATIQRVGATQNKRLNVQIIAATNRVLGAMVASGSFRQDLFYRLSVVTLRLPPLRECPDIFEQLVDRFLTDVERRRGLPLKMDVACRQRLHAHRMPGNIRELQNIIEHLAVVCGRTVKLTELVEALGDAHLSAQKSDHADSRSVSSAAGESLAQSVRRFEAQIIQDAILKTGSKRKAATLLGVDIATISRKSRRAD